MRRCLRNTHTLVKHIKTLITAIIPTYIAFRHHSVTLLTYKGGFSIYNVISRIAEETVGRH